MDRQNNSPAQADRPLTPARTEPTALGALLNRVAHGDCLTVMRTMPNEGVDLVLTDPPYLVNYRPRDGRRCPNDDDPGWLVPAFQELFRVLKSDSFCACFCGCPWIDRFMQAWKHAGFRAVSHLVWVKP